MSDDEFLQAMLSAWENAFNQGRDVSAAELCRDRPHLAGRLAAEIAGRKRMRPLQSTLPPTSPTQAPPPRPPSRSGRYRVVRYHASGGLGDVFVAHDEELGREVALKLIQKKHAHRRDNRRRFVGEAEITGRLEHPGVVPVYGLSVDEDGQPFYAMRFIHGEDLREAIQAYHAANAAGRKPGERSLALRELLHRLVAACHAVAYAHSRGVVHRDLKPANIMLGKYDETLVVDWGLAKRVARTEEQRDSGEESLPPPSPDDLETAPGFAAGTVAYMSPEQAEGDWDCVGPASDVASLGATLYHILTGEAPFKSLEQL